MGGESVKTASTPRHSSRIAAGLVVRILVGSVLVLVSSNTAAAEPGSCGRDRTAKAGVYLLSTERDGGRCTVVTEDRDEFGDRRIAEVTIVGDYAATLYSAKNYAGTSSTFVRDASNRNLRVGSVRIRRGRCDGRPGVYLYSDTNYRGRCSRFTSDTRALYQEYVLANTASSIKMVGSYVATLYRSTVFASTPATFSIADASLSNNSIGNDRVGSLRVRPTYQVCGTGVGIYLYEGAGFSLRCSRFTSDAPSLGAFYVGEDTTSSIRLFGGYQATISADSDYKGASSVFTGPFDDDLSDDAIGDDRASSLNITGPPPEQEVVRRVQVRIGTGDVSDAGTDDSVLVSLNHKNATWVDYGRDDFERGDAYTYDVLLDDVSEFQHLGWLTVSKTGSDGWCISRLEIRVNRQEPSFGRTFSPCRWLDSDSSERLSVSIPFDSLRGSRWSGYSPPPRDRQLVVTNDELDRRIAGIVGNALHRSPAEWRELGSNSVLISRANAQAIHVVLKLSGHAFLLQDPNIDLSFDLQLSCKDGDDGQDAEIRLKMANLDANVDFPGDVGILNPLAKMVAKSIKAAFPEIDEVLGVPSPRCPQIFIGGDGAIVFFPDLRPPRDRHAVSSGCARQSDQPQIQPAKQQT